MTNAYPRRHRRAFYGILAAFVLLAAAYSVTVPIFEAPDELFHYPMVEHLAAERALPVLPTEPGAEVGPWEQEGGQPPLYYVLAALLTAPINTDDLAEVRHLNPQAARGVATADRSNLNVVVHDPARERFPWRGTVLAIHVARLFSVACGAAAVALGWHLLQTLLPERPNLALSAAAVHAFTPMFIFISSAVTNDALIIPLGIAGVLIMARLIQTPGVAWPRFIPLGVVLGLAALTKASGLALIPLAVAATAWTCWRPKTQRLRQMGGAFVKRALGWSLPLLLIAGGWYARNLVLYGDLLGFNAFLAVIGERQAPLTWQALWQERGSFLTSYWGNFGWLNVLMPQAVYTVLNTLALAAGGGVLAALGRRLPAFWRSLQAHRDLVAARLLTALWPAALFVSLIRWTRTTMASQGRLVFPALPLWSLGLVWGLTVWLRRQSRIRRSVLAAIPALFLTLSIAALPAWIAPAYRPPSPLPEDVDIPQRLNATFGDNLRLLGYELEDQAVRAGEPVVLDLYWEALAPTPSEHLVFVHLVGKAERIVAQADRFPGRGLLDTTRLPPGYRWRERYQITLPTTSYAPDTLTVSVGLYDRATGRRLPVDNGDTVHFGALDVTRKASTVPNPIDVRFGDGMALVGYDVSALRVAAGETVTVTLHWACRAPMPGDYTVSLQLIDEQWRKAAQSDAWPLDGAAPTSTWMPDETYREQRALTVAPDVVPGVYDLRLAAYHVVEGEIVHLPTYNKSNTLPADMITLTGIQIQP